MYTSYLLVPDQVFQPGAGQRQVRGKFAEGQGMGWGANAPPEAKPGLALDAKKEADLEKSKGGYDYADKADEERRARGGGSAMEVMRYIGSKTFYNSGGTWLDSAYDPAKHKDLKVVKVNSDEYFTLLAEKEGLAKYMSLTQVVLCFDGAWYKFEK
jgi:hypothetical protein